MQASIPSRAWLVPVVVVVVVVLAACGTTVPTQIPSTPPSPEPSPAATTPPPTAEPPAEPVTPSPVALQPRGVEAFQAIKSGHWEMAATESNLGPVSEIKILRPMTEFVEVNAVCSGTGTLQVRVTAAPPANASQDPSASTTPLVDTTINCPDGIAFSLAGSAPAGWFANPDSVPSDPSIRYEVLVGTIVD